MQMRIEPLNRIIALGFFMSPVLIFTDRKADFVLSDAQLQYACNCEIFLKFRSVRKLTLSE
jgi:hypothetical protein